MTISIVIPNWNGEEKMRRHLPKVIEAAQENKIEEIIVVDDASTDESVEVLEKKFPQVILIKKSANSGFSSTVNSGVKEAKGELVVLLNNDASPQNDFLKHALTHFDDKKVFSVGFYVGGEGLWSTGKFEKGYFWHNKVEAKEVKELAVHQALWASGGGQIFRKSVWQELGGLDELFDPFYEEDVDLGFRATKRGYINLWEPRAKIIHYHEKGVIAANFPPSRVTEVAQRNQLFFIWKNITDPLMIKQHICALTKMLLLHPSYWKVFLNALIKLPAILAKRKIEQDKAKLTDQEIFQRFRIG